jgi:prepilin-type N-terminal cleavage/methylation domain-containing protein
MNLTLKGVEIYLKGNIRRITMFKFVNKKLRNRKGFTLIELVVVIAILGILALIAVPRLAGVRDNAQETADLATARSIASAVSIYEADNGVKPADIDDLVPDYLNDVPTGASINWIGTDNNQLEVTVGDQTITP